MNILIVSTYPPMPCGIGKYAEQQVNALRKQGHRVDLLTPAEADGDFHEELLGGWRPLLMLKYVWAYDETIIHYAPQFFYLSEDRRSRFKTSFAFLLIMLLFGRRVGFLIHETGFKIGNHEKGRLRYLIDRFYWRMARRIIFHSHREKDGFSEYYGLDSTSPRFEVYPHDKYMVRHCELSQLEARQQLNVDPQAVLLLCIGFIQPHKGFDRAISALAQVNAPNVHLRVVGSVRLIWDKAHQYAHMLHDMADADPRVEVLEAYLSDEMFDTWIVASDYVIVPYHEIWTSSIAARSKLYGRPLIAANVGGLAEQQTPGSMLFSSDEELAQIIQKIADEHPPKGAVSAQAAKNGGPLEQATGAPPKTQEAPAAADAKPAEQTLLELKIP